MRIYRERCPTLRVGRHGILYVRNGFLRKLSGQESLLLQGFTLGQSQKVKQINQRDLLTQAGNAFTVNVIKSIGEMIIKQIPI